MQGNDSGITEGDIAMLPVFVKAVADHEAKKIQKSAKFVTPNFKYATKEIQSPSFCFAGELKTMTRAKAEAKVKALGGYVSPIVSSGLSYLVTMSLNRDRKKYLLPEKMASQLLMKINSLTCSKISYKKQKLNNHLHFLLTYVQFVRIIKS